MQNIILINETEDKSIEEIAKSVVKNSKLSGEVKILGEDEDKGEIYLSLGGISYTILLKKIEVCSVDKYSVSWVLYKGESLEAEDKEEISSGDDIIEFIDENREEKKKLEFEILKNNIDKSYVIGNIDDELRIENDKLNSKHYLNKDFEEYLQKHNKSDINFEIKPYGVDSIDRIQFEVTQTNDMYNGVCHKTILCLRKTSESKEFKVEDRYLAYDKCIAQGALNLIIDFLDEYYK